MNPQPPVLNKTTTLDVSKPANYTVEAIKASAPLSAFELETLRLQKEQREYDAMKLKAERHDNKKKQLNVLVNTFNNNALSLTFELAKSVSMAQLKANDFDSAVTTINEFKRYNKMMMRRGVNAKPMTLTELFTNWNKTTILD
jgi:hypothetical protein